jgi:benzoate 4-monooxygenase
MLKAAKDIAPVAKSQTNAMATYGNEKAEVEYIPAVRILNERGDYSASMGVLPPWVRLFLKNFHPWYRKGSASTDNLTGMAIAAVSERLKAPTDRVDLLSKLQQGKDDEGKPMGPPELTAEVLTQLIAGSENIST